MDVLSSFGSSEYSVSAVMFTSSVVISFSITVLLLSHVDSVNPSNSKPYIELV